MARAVNPATAANKLLQMIQKGEYTTAKAAAAAHPEYASGLQLIEAAAGIVQKTDDQSAASTQPKRTGSGAPEDGRRKSLLVR